MSSPSRPSFINLWKKYFQAFNEHSYTDVRACLSSSLEIWVRGKLVEKDSWERVEANYREHWALPNCVVTIESIEESNDGVMTKLVDHARNQLLHVKYTYELEDGEWLQVRHEIGEVADWHDKERSDGV
jgi:hypothetical protein